MQFRQVSELCLHHLQQLQMTNCQTSNEMQDESRILDLIFEQLKDARESDIAMNKKIDALSENIIRMEERAKSKATLISAIMGAIAIIISAIIAAFKNHT